MAGVKSQFGNSVGYQVYHEDGENVSIHRLVAVAHFGYDKVCGKVVHHKNGIKCINSPSNLELMDVQEHSRHHAEEKEVEYPLITSNICAAARQKYENGQTITQLADEFNASTSAVWKHLAAKCEHAKDDITQGHSGPRNGPWRNRNIFKREYVRNRKSMAELADEWGCSTATVYTWKQKHGLGHDNR